MFKAKFLIIFTLIFIVNVLLSCADQLRTIPLPLLRLSPAEILKLSPNLTEDSSSKLKEISGTEDNLKVNNDTKITFFKSSKRVFRSAESLTTASNKNLKLRCGVEASHDRIVGGENAELQEFPWLALLFYQNKPTDPIRYKCGGTLISTKTVVTAAHCVEGNLREHLKYIRLGEWNTTSDLDCVDEEECSDTPIDYEPEKIIVHPERSQMDKNNDIALIVLKDVPPYTDFIRPICLPSSTFDPEVKSVTQALLVAGWGSTDEFGEIPATIKQKLKLNYFPFNDCFNLFKAKNVELNSEKIICAGGTRGKGACRGDSGGPLMLWNRGVYSLTGVVSFGYAQCALQADKPAVFTRTWHYLDWIKENVI